MIPQWARHYRRSQLPGDLAAGVIVALMLIPQGMAYALVAELPPEAGLYASILPPVAYALFGTSSTQSVGPMAITSLMTATALVALAPAGSPLYGALSVQLALLTGMVLLLCGVLRLGFMSGFLSRPVLAGFTTGAAILIAAGQAPVLLLDAASRPDLHTALIGGGSLVLLWLARVRLAAWLAAAGVRPAHAQVCARLAPALVILASMLAVVTLDLEQQGMRVLGAVPRGLPDLGLAFSLAHWRELLVPALLIAFVVFISSQSGAVALAQKRGERIRANGELLGLGAANLASAVSGGLPVTGSISRSAANQEAGANTPLASLVSAGLLAAVISLPTAWLAPLPLAALAATIIVAIIGMIDVAALKETWRYDRGDAMAMLVTALGVLVLGVDRGVLVGVVVSLGTLIGRASRPNIVSVGRSPGSEFFRDSARHAEVEILPQVLMLRMDAAIWFGNSETLVNRVEQELQERPAVRHLVLVMSAVNHVDATGLLALRELNRSLAGRGVQLHLAKVKELVLDRLRMSRLLSELHGQVFHSPAQAFRELGGGQQSQSM